MQSCLHWVKGQLLALLAVLLALGLALALPLVASAHAILLRSDPVGNRSGLASRTAARPLLPGLLLDPDVGHVRGEGGQPCTDGGIDRSDGRGENVPRRRAVAPSYRGRLAAVGCLVVGPSHLARECIARASLESRWLPISTEGSHPFQRARASHGSCERSLVKKPLALIIHRLKESLLR